ncbi:GGDEF domain-containing protein [Neptunicella marina]|uniref:diguanylate cyclase n=1 Tax=Neptunicella marina TaxID=2125989 RepID=A0A8J6IU00_9ALTE|nr:GGDEF domain-containing protein [Neptunicella marina]MBC3765596.1 GGDEF domain-containing protein [Neptunicella marina]
MNTESSANSRYNQQRIYAECVRMVYRNRAYNLMGVVLVSFVIIIVGWTENSRVNPVILASLLWIYVAQAYLTSRKFNTSSIANNKTPFWGKLLYIQLVSLAILYNFIFMTLAFNGVEDALLLLLIVTLGFTGGTIGSYHQMKWAPHMYTFGAILPQTVYYISLQTVYGTLITILLLCILGFLAMVSIQQHKSWIRTLTLSFELEEANKRAKHLARIDLLTNLYNRRAFYELAPKSLATCRRYNHQACVVMVDIDHFKNINDNFGHNVGDTVLQKIASVLQIKLRESDIVARIGGEEFALFLTQTDIDSAFIIIERLRQQIEQLDFSHFGIKNAITSCFGIASISETAESIDDLLIKADSALYEAKHLGRNRTVLYQEAEPAS